MGGVSVEVRPSTGMSAATSRPSTGLHSSGSHNRSSSSGGIPHSIRLPPRYVAEAARAEARMETRAVDPEAIRRAFQVWDSDDDGRIDVDDLKSFVVRTALQAPVGGWDAYLEAMVAEALRRTGFAAPVGHGASSSVLVMTVPDVQAASSFRVHPTSREFIGRPYRDAWITLVRSALPPADAAIFEPPHPGDAMYAPPIMTNRERRAVERSVAGASQLLGGTRTSQSAPSLFGPDASVLSTGTPLGESGLFRGILTSSGSTLRPRTTGGGGAVRMDGRRARNRADGRQYSVPTAVDPHIDLAHALEARLCGDESDESEPRLDAGAEGSYCAFGSHAAHKKLTRQIETWSKKDLAAGDGASEDASDKASDAPRAARVVAGRLVQPRWNAHPKFKYAELLSTNARLDSTASGLSQTARDARELHARMALEGHSAANLEEQRRLMASDNMQVTLIRGNVDVLFTKRDGDDDYCYHWRTESKHEHMVRMSKWGTRHMLGKSRQACFTLDEVLPYTHTTRNDDPSGYDRRSRLVTEYEKTTVRSPFALYMPKAQAPPLTSALGSNTASINFVKLANEGSIAYDRVAIHPTYSKHRHKKKPGKGA